MLPDTGKLPTSLFCAHFSENPGTLSSLLFICTMLSLDLIEFTAQRQARGFIFVGRHLYNTFSRLNQVHRLTTRFKKTHFIQIGSASLFLIPTSLIPLHSVTPLLSVSILPWALWIPYRILRSSHRCHWWPLSEMMVCCICLLRVVIVV